MSSNGTGEWLRANSDLGIALSRLEIHSCPDRLAVDIPLPETQLTPRKAFDLIGEEFSYLSGLWPRSLDQNETVQDIESSAWNYRTDADVNYEPFTSW